MIDLFGRVAARAEDATQSHISTSILVYEEIKKKTRRRGACSGAKYERVVHPPRICGADVAQDHSVEFEGFDPAEIRGVRDQICTT